MRGALDLLGNLILGLLVIPIAIAVSLVAGAILTGAAVKDVVDDWLDDRRARRGER